MKIGIISDIHGNYPALKAVLADALKNQVDSFILAGDYIFDLPYPNEVTDLIRGLQNAAVIRGNKEGYLAGLMKEERTNEGIEQIGALHQTYKELTPVNMAYLMGLPESGYIPLPFSGRAYVTHMIRDLVSGPKRIECSSSRFREEMERKPFTHKEYLESIGRFLNESGTGAVLSKINASVIIFGHIHLQWHGYCGDQLVINPGACGLPLDYDNRAAYTILKDSRAGLTVEERRVFYDVERTIFDSQHAAICQRGKVWCDLVFAALRNARDEFSSFFQLAESLAMTKNETGYYYSNETWNQAAEIFWKQ